MKNAELFALTHDTSKCTARIAQLVELLKKQPTQDEVDLYHDTILNAAKEIDQTIDTYYKTQTK